MRGFCKKCDKIKRVKSYESYIDKKDNSLHETIIYSCNHTIKIINFDEID